MPRVGRALLVTIAVGALVASTPAEAAKPAGGTLSKSRKTLKWSGGPYNFSYPTTDFACLDGPNDSNCDHFLLKVNMGQGARINVSTTCSKSGLEPIQNFGPGPNDFDLFVFDPNGDEIGVSRSNFCEDSVSFTHKGKFRNKAYEVRVVPALVVPGTTYSGKAKTLKFVK